MALKALMIRKKIDAKQKELQALRTQEEDLIKREAELEGMIAEADTEDEQRAVEEEIEKFNTEKANTAEAIKALDDEVRELEEALSNEGVYLVKTKPGRADAVLAAYLAGELEF